MPTTQTCTSCSKVKPLEEPFSPCDDCGRWVCTDCRVLVDIDMAWWRQEQRHVYTCKDCRFL